MRAGDSDAYAELVRRHAHAAHRTAVFLGAGADAEDIVQESLVKAYRALGGFRKGASFRPWLLRIVANETRNLHRSARRRVAREIASQDLFLGTDEAADPATSALTAERRSELLAALARLSEPYRRVIACRYLLDLDETETATVLGWPRGTVKSRLHRGLRRLHRRLEAAAPAASELSVGEVSHGER